MLGIFVLSTSALEPTESAFAENPYIGTFNFNPENYLYRIPVEFEVNSGREIYYVNGNPITIDEIYNATGNTIEFNYNFLYICVEYFAQNEDGDLELYTYYSKPIVFNTLTDYYNTSIFDGYEDTISVISKEYSSNIIEGSVGFRDFPDSIEDFYYCVGDNPERYAYNQGYINGSSGVDTDIFYDEGYNNGYQIGYDTASSEIENQNALGLFGRGILDGILDIYFDTFRIPIFGTSLGEILGYFFFFVFVLVVVKIVSFVI